MAFTELYITQDAGANENNGGSGTGACKADEVALNNIDAVQIATYDHYLENKDADGWGTTAVGDYLLFDVASAKKWCRVVGLNYAGSAQKIEVHSLSGTASIAAAGKGVRVGGAWTWAGAAARLTSAGATNWTVGAFADIPRLNVSTASGVAYSVATSFLFQTNAWSEVCPLIIAGYDTTPGDVDHWASTSRAIIDWGANNAYPSFNQNYTFVYNIKSTGSFNGTWRGFYGTGQGCSFINCESVYTGVNNNGTCFYGAGNYLSYIRCRAERTQSNTGNGFYAPNSTTRYVGCEAVGPENAASRGNGFFLAAAAATMLNCIARKNSIGVYCTSYGATIKDCTLIDNVDTIKFATTNYGPLTAVILNNKIANNSGYGITSGLAIVAWMPCEDFNEFYTNSTGDINTGVLTSQATADMVDVADPFWDYAGGDYRPGKAAAGNDAGFPGVMAAAGSTYTGYCDTGALGRRHGVVIVRRDTKSVVIPPY